MIGTIAMGSIAVLFAYLGRYRNFPFGLKLSFVCIFIFLALRYNFGNDYKSYLEIFTEVNRYASFDLFDKTIHADPGWILLCKLFKPFGFFAMIAVLALFNSIIYYRFIKKYVPKKYYWLAIFLYVFTPGFLLTHATAMRQSLAIGLFILSLDYLFKKDAIRYYVCVALASLMHSSALILVPLYLLSFVNWRLNKIAVVLMVGVFASLFVFVQELGPYINFVIGTYFKSYEVYQEAVAVGTGIGVLYSAFLFVIILWYERFQNKETALVFKVAILSFLFIPLGFLIALIGRMGMYFAPATFIALPVILVYIKKVNYKMIFIASLLLMTMYNFFQFFRSETYRQAFSTYQTIFSSRKLY